MDDYEDDFDGGVAVALITIEVYKFNSGMFFPHPNHPRVDQGYFKCDGFRDINPVMVESVEYVDTSFTEYEKKTTPGRWLWWTYENTVYEPHVTRCYFYRHVMASGQELLTKEPILPGTGLRDQDESFEVKYDDKVRPLFGQEFPGDDE